MAAWKVHRFALTPSGAKRLAKVEDMNAQLLAMSRGERGGVVCQCCGLSVAELQELGPWVQCMERPRYLPFIVRNELAGRGAVLEDWKSQPEGLWVEALAAMVMTQFSTELNILTMGLGQRVFKER